MFNYKEFVRIASLARPNCVNYFTWSHLLVWMINSVEFHHQLMKLESTIQFRPTKFNSSIDWFGFEFLTELWLFC